MHTSAGIRFGTRCCDTKNAKPKLRIILWKVIPPLNGLYYLGVVKNRHFAPHAERSENETPSWFLIQKYPKALEQEKTSEK